MTVQPIPVEILKQYPLPCVVPGRPWWKLEEDNPARGWLSFERYGPRYTTPGYALAQADLEFHSRADLQARCARMDVEHPTPFPGFRVGQIWVWRSVANNGFITSSIVDVAPSEIALVDVSGGLRVQRVGVVPACALWLLHDPVCPWFAPWGAPEPTEAPQP